MSTSASPPEAGNGAPPAPPRARRDLRDSFWGRAALLGIVLVAALLASRSCASREDQITQEQAVQLAIDNASFTPCAQQRCRQVRFIQRGIPPVPYWGVVLSMELDAEGQPTKVESFLVNARTGEVSRA